MAPLNRMATSPDDTGPADELQPEYDFRSLRGVVRGQYAARYQERLRVVRLAADVSAAFADEAAVNDALREYLRAAPSTPARGEPGRARLRPSRENPAARTAT